MEEKPSKPSWPDRVATYVTIWALQEGSFWKLRRILVMGSIGILSLPWMWGWTRLGTEWVDRSGRARRVPDDYWWPLRDTQDTPTCGLKTTSIHYCVIESTLMYRVLQYLRLLRSSSSNLCDRIPDQFLRPYFCFCFHSRPLFIRCSICQIEPM